MAIISSGVLGDIRGKIADVNFRQEGGVTIVSSRAANYKVSNSEASVKNRNSFGFSSRVCTAIRKIFILNNIWRFSAIKGRTVSNKQLCINKRLVNSIEELDQLIMAPAESFFEASMQSYSLVDKCLRITINPLNLPRYFKRHSVSAQGLIYCFNPRKESTDDYAFIPVTSVAREFSESESLEFSFKISDWDTITLYESSGFVINLIIYDGMGEAMEVSVNLTCSLLESS